MCMLMSYFKIFQKEGINIGAKSIFGPEPLYADELTRCAGQRIAFAIADTQKNADTAAEMAIVDYDTKDLEPPILTVEQATQLKIVFHFQFFSFETVHLVFFACYPDYF